MSRGLTAGQIANIEQQSMRVETLLEFYLQDSNTFYYTTGSFPLTITTATAGSQTFTPSSFISDIGGIQESFQARPNSVSIQRTQGNDSFENYLTEDCIGSRVVLYKLFRDNTTAAPDTSNGLMQIFDGVISGLDFELTTDANTFTIRCTGGFADYDKIKGRTSASIPGSLGGQRIYWGSFYLE